MHCSCIVASLRVVECSFARIQKHARRSARAQNHDHDRIKRDFCAPFTKPERFCGGNARTVLNCPECVSWHGAVTSPRPWVLVFVFVSWWERGSRNSVPSFLWSLFHTDRCVSWHGAVTSPRPWVLVFVFVSWWERGSRTSVPSSLWSLSWSCACFNLVGWRFLLHGGDSCSFVFDMDPQDQQLSMAVRRFQRVRRRLAMDFGNGTEITLLQPDLRDAITLRDRINVMLENLRTRYERTVDIPALDQLDAWSTEFDQLCSIILRVQSALCAQKCTPLPPTPPPPEPVEVGNFLTPASLDAQAASTTVHIPTVATKGVNVHGLCLEWPVPWLHGYSILFTFYRLLQLLLTVCILWIRFHVTPTTSGQPLSCSAEPIRDS